MVLYPPHQPPPHEAPKVRLVLVFEGEDVGPAANRLKADGLDHRAKMLGLRLVSTDILHDDEPPPAAA